LAYFLCSEETLDHAPWYVNRIVPMTVACSIHPIVEAKLDGKAPTTNRTPWKESWNIERCGQMKEYVINFTPVATGGTMIGITK